MSALPHQPDVPPDLMEKFSSNANPYPFPGENRRIDRAGIGYDPDATRGRHLMKTVPPGATFEENTDPKEIWNPSEASHSFVAQFLSWNAGNLNRDAKNDKRPRFHCITVDDCMHSRSKHGMCITRPSCTTCFALFYLG